MAQEVGLEQLVYFSTRQENTMDLVFIRHPGFKVMSKALLPIIPKGDHDSALFETSHQPYRPILGIQVDKFSCGRTSTPCE